MSGIYLHVPFCAKACHYCDFHFSTNHNLKMTMVEMMAKELFLRKSELPAEVTTIYFGGGTPSLLEIEDLSVLFNSLLKNFDISNVEEITLEANPEDVTAEKVKSWKEMGINRISLGGQTFNDSILQKFNRNHSADQTIRAIDLLSQNGIENISLDLIYGFNDDVENWERDLSLVFNLPIKHLSCYQLTFEEKTVLGNWLKKGKTKMISDEKSYLLLKMLEEKIEVQGWEWYEISNFTKPGYYSKHNSSYWKDKPYLGIGPSAHSFDGNDKRTINVANNHTYVEKLSMGEHATKETEKLNHTERDIEKVLIGLRTKWGLKIENLHNKEKMEIILNNSSLKQYFSSNLLWFADGTLNLTRDGFYMADKIILDIISEFD